ncbi:MAG: hypothetical protein JST80_11555 [Bdellovibrionales bacterium]|nr:hypothetical protein [Bdellovibrionales bacterium]
MTQEVKNALTAGNCQNALDLSGQLYQSSYSDNNIRMLYASAHACNIGISLYKLLDDITTADFSTTDSIFRTLVRLFPSKAATDTRLESANLAQDALMSTIPRGTVVGVSNSFYTTSFNPGSVLTRDRTLDANIYLTFISMASVGAGLNRFGYNAATDPATLGYGQEIAMPFTSQVAIKGDATKEGCAIASSLLNMFDSIAILAAQTPGSVSAALTTMTTLLQTTMTSQATAQCIGDGFTGPECANAIQRLRFRGACFGSDSAASAAAGIIAQINTFWL